MASARTGARTGAKANPPRNPPNSQRFLTPWARANPWAPVRAVADGAVAHRRLLPLGCCGQSWGQGCQGLAETGLRYGRLPRPWKGHGGELAWGVRTPALVAKTGGLAKHHAPIPRRQAGIHNQVCLSLALHPLPPPQQRHQDHLGTGLWLPQGQHTGPAIGKPLVCPRQRQQPGRGGAPWPAPPHHTAPWCRR